jgi:hypothetical protein
LDGKWPSGRLFPENVPQQEQPVLMTDAQLRQI